MRCLAKKELQEKLEGYILVLHFCRTESGWKVWTLHKAMDAQPIEEHLEQARKWAAEWEDASPGAEARDEAESTPEQVAHAFMDALRRRDSEQTAKLIDRPVSQRELDNIAGMLNQLYGADPGRLTTFAEWYQEEPYAVAALSGPPDRPNSKLVIILNRSGETWKVTAGPLPSDSNTSLADNLRRVIKDRERGVDQAKALPVTPPVTMPEGSLITVEQAKEILEKVTWGEFIATFADDGHEHEVSWREVPANGRNGLRIEVSFHFGGERMLLDLEVDPEFRQATPSRLRPAKNPEPILADAARFFPQMVLRYAVESKHPATAPAVEKAMERVRQTRDLSTMREYAVAIEICRADTGSLPANLQTLVEKKYLREAKLLMNHGTGEMESPLYHGSPDLRVKDLDVKTILLAGPSADKSGKRAVGFLDGSVKVIAEADYQAQLKAQQKPPISD